MRCPACDAEVPDGSTGACPSCGSSVVDELSATEELDVPVSAATTDGADTTAVLETAPVDARGWVRSASDALAAAAVAFLLVCAVGALALGAVKLRFPSTGAGADPVGVLTSVVILALACLRVPVAAGRLEAHALPLGAFAACAWALVWAGRTLAQRSRATTTWGAVVAGARLGPPFAALCFVAALAFRFASARSPVHAQALPALGLGLLWGTLFGALGGLAAGGGVLEALASLRRRLSLRSRDAAAGLYAGSLMLVAALTAAGGGALAWVIAGLFGEGNLPLTPLQVAGSVALVILVLPNLAALGIALAVGGAIELSAKTTLGGELRGPGREFSLFDWPGRGGPPLTAWALPLGAVAMCALGAYLARRRAPAARPLGSIVVAAAVFVGAVVLLVWLGEAHLSAAPGRRRGFGRLGAELPSVALGAAVCALVGGVAGWLLAGRRPRSRGTSEEGT